MNTVPSTSLRTLTVEFQSFDDNTFPSMRAKNTGSPGREYHYLYTGSRNIKVGDYALVHNGNNFGMTKILRIQPGISDKVRKHVITVVTVEDFERYQEANASIVNHRQVFDELDYMLAEKAKMAKYDELAKNDPRAKELLDSLLVYTGPVLDAPLPPFEMSGQTVEESERIPQGWVYDQSVHTFRGPTGKPCDASFYNKWLSRASQFPQQVN